MSLGSILNATRIFFYYLAWVYTSIAKGTIILYTFPIFFTIFGSIFLNEKLNKKSIILIILAFIGTTFIFFDPTSAWNKNDLIGMLSMLAEAILFSLAMVIFKKESNNYSEIETVFWQNIVGAIIMIPVILIVGFKTSAINMVIVAGYTGLISGLVGFLLFFYALKRLNVSHYSLMTYFEVVASIFFAVTLLGEKLSWNMVLGGTRIIGSGLALVFSKSKTIAESTMLPE
jgi:drug/metabolite transporter (DMT)-like permease